MSSKPIPDVSSVIKDPRQRKEFAVFWDALGEEDSDATMLVLRGHLYAESLLERLIRIGLPRGDKIIDNGAYSFAQKLVLVEALNSVRDEHISSLRSLNKLRNQCAHDLGKAIVLVDVTRVGSSLGKDYTRIRLSNEDSVLPVLRGVLGMICGALSRSCIKIEDDHIAALEPKSPKLEKAKPSD